MLVYLIVVAVLTVMADQSVFVRPPQNFLERVVAIPGAIAYPLCHSRLFSAGVACVCIAIVAGVAGAAAWWAIQRFVMEPMHIRRIVRVTRREEELYNKFRSGE